LFQGFGDFGEEGFRVVMVEDDDPFGMFQFFFSLCVLDFLENWTLGEIKY
jgi:hypothetical protein